jgi:HK97 family phage portal protein
MTPETARWQGGRWVRIADPSVVRAPSALMRRRPWVASMASSLVLHGNAYGLVTSFDAQAWPTFVEPVHPSRVSWRADGVTVDGVGEKLWPSGRLLHVPASPFLRAGQLTADSPVERAKESIGASLAAGEFGARFFADGVFPTSVITSDQDLTPETARGLKQAVMSSVRGREPLVVGSGLKVEPRGVSPTDSQFIDTQRFETEQIARFFGVPPTMIYGAVSGQAVTYSNVTQDDLAFLKHSLKSWVEDLEDGWSALLPSPQRVRLNADDFLRMDAVTRHKDQQVRLGNMATTVNEIRAEEDKDPFVELDDDGSNIFDKPGMPGGAPASVVPDVGGDNEGDM